MDPNLDYWLKPHVLARTRREREELVDELRGVMAAAGADTPLFDLLKRTADALEICEHQLSCVLPPVPIPEDPEIDKLVDDVQRQLEERMRREDAD